MAGTIAAMTGWVRGRRSRRGTSMLELCFCFLAMWAVVMGVIAIGSYYWGATTLSTTADIASLSAQSAYDRVRFGAGVLGAGDQRNQADARRLAEQAAATVIDGAAEPGKGPFSFGADSCESGVPGSPISRELEVDEFPVAGYDGHHFEIRLTAPVGWRAGCQTVNSSISSARLGR